MANLLALVFLFICCFIVCSHATPGSKMTELKGFDDKNPKRRMFTNEDFSGTYTRFMELSRVGQQLCPREIRITSNGVILKNKSVEVLHSSFQFDGIVCSDTGSMTFSPKTKLSPKEITEAFKLSSTDTGTFQKVLYQILTEVEGIYYGIESKSLTCNQGFLEEGTAVLFSSDSSIFGRDLRIPFHGLPIIIYVRDVKKSCAYSGPWSRSPLLSDLTNLGGTTNPATTTNTEGSDSQPKGTGSSTSNSNSGSGGASSPRPTSAVASTPKSGTNQQNAQGPTITVSPSPSFVSLVSSPSNTPSIQSSNSMAPGVSNTMMPSVSSSMAPSISGTIIPSVTPVVSGSMIPAGSTPVIPSASNTIPPAGSNTFTPSVSSTKTPGVSSTIPPAGSSNFTPSVSSTKTPGVSSTIPPAGSNTFTPSVSSTITPGASNTIAASISYSPAASNTPDSSGTTPSIKPSASPTVVQNANGSGLPSPKSTPFDLGLNGNPKEGDLSITPSPDVTEMYRATPTVSAKAPMTAVASASTTTPSSAQTSQSASRSSSPSPTSSGESTCFPSHALVTLASGERVRMDKLKIGDIVHVGGGIFSPIIAFTHSSPLVTAMFVQFKTESGHLASATGSHFMYSSNGLRPAGELFTDDLLKLANGTMSKIMERKEVLGVGLYNPQTAQGNIDVDGILASTYTTCIHPRSAHSLLAPIRMLYSLNIATSFVSVLSGKAWVVDIARVLLSD